MDNETIALSWYTPESFRQLKAAAEGAGAPIEKSYEEFVIEFDRTARAFERMGRTVRRLTINVAHMIERLAANGLEIDEAGRELYVRSLAGGGGAWRLGRLRRRCAIVGVDYQEQRGSGTLTCWQPPNDGQPIDTRWGRRRGDNKPPDGLLSSRLGGPLWRKMRRSNPGAVESFWSGSARDGVDPVINPEGVEPMPINLNEIRKTWAAKYGAPLAARMMAGASGHAYDSRFGLSGRRPARDQEPDDNDASSGLAAIKTFLKNRLDPQDFVRLEKMLSQLSGEGGEEPDDTAQRQYERERYAPEGQDEPPGTGRADLLPTGRNYQNIPEEWHKEFPESPTRDRRPAMDSRGNDYFSLCPANARVTFGYGD